MINVARYEQLLEEAIDAFPGTPEELGALIATATSKLASIAFYPTDFCQQKREEKASARRLIRSLPNGQEILDIEDQLYVN